MAFLLLLGADDPGAGGGNHDDGFAWRSPCHAEGAEVAMSMGEVPAWLLLVTGAVGLVLGWIGGYWASFGAVLARAKRAAGEGKTLVLEHAGEYWFLVSEERYQDLKAADRRESQRRFYQAGDRDASHG
jgi:hypothetical protein